MHLYEALLTTGLVSDDDVARMKVSGGLPGYVKIAARLLAATFGDTPENPPSPQDA
jgi:hypothetical protein